MPELTGTAGATMVPAHDARSLAWNLIGGLFAFPPVHAMAELKIADHLGHGPLTAPQLAERIDADESSLARLLRMLVSIGMLERVADDTYALTSAGDVLRADHPASMRAAFLSIGEAGSWAAMGALARAVREGESAFSITIGTAPYDYFNDHPGARDAFHAFMAARSRDIAEALANTYDFSGVRNLMDVGGGIGTISARILRDHPQLHVTVYDLDTVEPNTNAHLGETRGIADRWTFQAGDFTRSIPTGDAHLVANVVHNQGDEAARNLLRNLKAAMPPEGRALFIDVLLPDAPESFTDVLADEVKQHFGFLLDMRMLAMFPSGQERTRSEYLTLLSDSGLEIVNVIALTGPISLIVARPSQRAAKPNAAGTGPAT